MTSITENIDFFRQKIPSSVKLIAVSKTKPVSDILEAYKAGQRCFGENRVQELLLKKDKLPPDIEWHLIGHLQSNKVKSIVPFITMIQSVDSFKLLETINSEASKVDRKIDCLLQIHIAKEETKFGFALEELTGFLNDTLYKELKFVRICGVMGIATFTSDNNLIHKEFRMLKECFDSLKNSYFEGSPHFKEISMGMSSDYKIAITEGSTIVRIGSHIFGERQLIK
jgi:PLP dependent protein